MFQGSAHSACHDLTRIFILVTNQEIMVVSTEQDNILIPASSLLNSGIQSKYCNINKVNRQTQRTRGGTSIIGI